MTRIAVLIGSLVALTAGCFGGDSVPTMQYYRLPIWKHVKAPPGERLRVVIQIEAPDVDGAYDHLRLVYRISPVELRHYRFRQWVTKPGRLFRSALKNYLRDTRRFRIVTENNRPVPQYVLQGRIYSLEQVEKGPKRAEWYAHLALNLRLHRASDSKLIWMHGFDKTVRVQKRRPEAIVAALTQILSSEFNRHLPRMIEKIVADRARTTPRPTPKPAVLPLPTEPRERVRPRRRGRRRR